MTATKAITATTIRSTALVWRKRKPPKPRPRRGNKKGEHTRIREFRGRTPNSEVQEFGVRPRNSRPPFFISLVGAFFLRSGARQPARHRVVPFVARILEHRCFTSRKGNLDSPGLFKR